MADSLRAFLAQILDYAGLFPPASLDLATAFANYQNYRQTDQSWMLGKFICPTSQLNNLAKLVADTELEFPVSALLNAADKDKTAGALRQQLEEIIHLQSNSKLVISSLEAKTLAPDESGNTSHWQQTLAYCEEIKQSLANQAMSVFLEFPHQWIESPNFYDYLVELREFNERQRHDSSPFIIGCKIRCGGLALGAIPAVEVVAKVIHGCGENRIPVKATAGLHQPLRHFDESHKIWHHGFVNLFAAGILFESSNLSRDNIIDVLSDSDPNHFQFNDTAMSWRDHSVNTKVIANVRQQGMIGFGSCSFTEPIEALQQLQWLPQ